VRNRILNPPEPSSWRLTTMKKLSEKHNERDFRGTCRRVVLTFVSRLLLLQNIAIRVEG
jgi:hypothetical protein